MDLSAAAAKVAVSEDKVRVWEGGQARPTVRQARILASAYGQPFAAFFLSEPPSFKLTIPRDYRQVSEGKRRVSSELRLDVLNAWNKREVALELMATQDARVPSFTYELSTDSDKEETGKSLRDLLGVEVVEQVGWRDQRLAMNEWRLRVERLGVLVLQSSGIDVDEMRAYSLYADPLPIIVLNRADPPAARSFSLLHELVHLLVRHEGICDLGNESQLSPKRQPIEVFCNAVTAACLIPRAALNRHAIVRAHDTGLDWNDAEIKQLAAVFSTSRETLLRRLVTLGLASRALYEQKRTQYQREYRDTARKAGFVPPAQNAVSLLGRRYVSLVLRGLDTGHLTQTEASDYLGLRLKHFSKLSRALSAER
jgi:Zn-dependent peptidase ImmA (M78 family)